MKSHKATLQWVLAVIFGGIAGNFSGPAMGAELWDRAVTVLAESAGYAPGYIVTDMRMTDKKGEVTQTSLMEMKISQGEDGAIQQEIIKMVADGEDQTEKAKADMAREEAGQDNSDKDGHSMSLSVGGHVWEKDKQDKVTVTELPETREIHGRQVKGFRFEDRSNEEKTTTGTAWIDPVSGYPVEAVFTEEPLPTGVKEMTFTARYTVRDGLWQMQEMETKGAAGFLIFKRNFVSNMKFDNYFKVKEIENVPGEGKDSVPGV